MSSRDKHTWWYLLWCNIKHRYKLISYSATSFMCLGTGIWAGKWVYIKHQENGSLFRTWNAPFVFDLHGVFHSIIVFAKRYYQVLEICHVDTFFCKKTLSILSFCESEFKYLRQGPSRLLYCDISNMKLSYKK